MRNDGNKWKGPVTVIGQDCKIVFIRHEGIYVCVQHCSCGTEFSVEGTIDKADESDRVSKTHLVANESDLESEKETLSISSYYINPQLSVTCQIKENEPLHL